VPEIPNVVQGTPVESDWGNDIRDRTLQRYADATQRDTLTPLPVAGDLAYLEDTGEVQCWSGAWLPIARVNFESILMYGDSQGYWLRPDPADNTKDWRIVAAGDLLLIQSRASGTFQTVAQFTGDDSPLVVSRTGNPVNSTTLSGESQDLGPAVDITRAGLWRVTQAGFIEASSNINATFTLRSRTTGGTAITEAQFQGLGTVTTTVRGNLASSVLFRFSGPNSLQLSIQRSAEQGTNLIRQWQLAAEYVTP